MRTNKALLILLTAMIAVLGIGSAAWAYYKLSTNPCYQLRDLYNARLKEMVETPPTITATPSATLTPIPTPLRSPTPVKIATPTIRVVRPSVVVSP